MAFQGGQMPKKKESKKIDPYRFNELYLENIFREAVEKHEVLLPDDAMKKLNSIMGKRLEIEGLDIATTRRKYPRIDDLVVLRKLHHYAVDLFYRTYFERGEGAPSLSNEYLQSIVEMRQKGLSYGEIAKEVGEQTTPPDELRKSSDKIRKQLDIAEKRGIKPSSVTSSKSRN